jgi:hypothetical protein
MTLLTRAQRVCGESILLRMIFVDVMQGLAQKTRARLLSTGLRAKQHTPDRGGVLRRPRLVSAPGSVLYFTRRLTDCGAQKPKNCEAIGDEDYP